MSKNFQQDQITLILASGSQIRYLMLKNAGLTVTVIKPNLDENSIKQAMRQEGANLVDTSISLATAKSIAISQRNHGSLVIGVDQMLEVKDIWLDKPLDLAAAKQNLQLLRGQWHSLYSAVTVARDGQSLWHHHDKARLYMRSFSDDWLDYYLQATGESVLETVGAYKLEGIGAQLFERVEGDFFTILGLPLLSLLRFLREHKVLLQ